jgi:antitoxin (DNA-binding transcriptional repressor) of toxin-antitoxin stability system
MTEPNRLGVQDVRQHLRKVIDDALIRGTATVVERHGEPVAAVVPYEWFQRAAASLASEERENISDRP